MHKFLYQIRLEITDENEEEILSFLHSHKIFERGNIISPTKDIWKKFYTSITFIWVSTAESKVHFGYGWAYRYITPKEKLHGEFIKAISFEEFKKKF